MDPNETYPLGPGRSPESSEGVPDVPEASPWLGRRKRIVAREVVTRETADVTREMLDAAGGAIRAIDVIDIPSLSAAPPEATIDPTQFLERQRRPSQNRVYQATQAALALTLIASCGAFLGTLMERRHRALAVALVACLSAGVAVKLVRSSRLAHRLRGYAAAACALALISLVACFVMPNLHAGEADEKKPATTQSS